jgi:hypothetical protein
MSLSRSRLRLSQKLRRVLPDVDREYSEDVRREVKTSFVGDALWYEGRIDWRALRKARMGLKSNCEKRFWLSVGWTVFCFGEPMSIAGVPWRKEGE